MTFEETKIGGVFKISPERREDERGYFTRTYDERLFKERGLSREWVQENESFSRAEGTVRGLHFQRAPHAEAKLLHVPRGKVFFAFVDLRSDSKTFGKWGSATLSEETAHMLFVPRGCALGMCTLADNCLLHYKMDNVYAPEYAETLKWDDTDIGIAWPLAEPSVISEKDKNGKNFKELAPKLPSGVEWEA